MGQRMEGLTYESELLIRTVVVPLPPLAEAIHLMLSMSNSFCFDFITHFFFHLSIHFTVALVHRCGNVEIMPGHAHLFLPQAKMEEESQDLNMPRLHCFVVLNYWE